MKKPRIYNNINGLLIINKPKGWTSFDVVAKVRNMLNVKKVGHTGTLDPMATGVLVLCLGKATKLAQKMIGLDKKYVAQITLGATSNTDDAEGEVVENKEAGVKSFKEVQQVLKAFEGVIQQTPPAYSAKKIKGKRAYKLAREGKKVELKPVDVTIYELEILHYKWPTLELRLKCSKGFYVRALARDVGEKLGVGGYLSALKRTRVGEYGLDGAVEIEEVSEEKVMGVRVV